MAANKKKYASESAARFMSTVTDDLLLEILIRLPRMSVAITVCKSWHSLIISNHPNTFLRHTLHHHHRQQRGDPDPSYTPPCMLLLKCEPIQPSVKVLCEKSKILDAALTRQSPEGGFVSNLNSKLIKASFKDSLLIDHNNQYCIYNPVTQEVRLLPYPPSANSSAIIKLMLVGTEEPNRVFRFRVVEFQFSLGAMTNSVMVFSSETDEWNESLLKFYPQNSWHQIAAAEGALLWQHNSGFCIYDPFRPGNGTSCCRIIKFPSGYIHKNYYYRTLQVGAVRGRFRVSQMVSDKKGRSLRIWELINGSDDQWRLLREVLLKTDMVEKPMAVAAFHPEDGDVIFVCGGSVIYRCQLTDREEDHKFKKVAEVSAGNFRSVSALHFSLRVFYPVGYIFGAHGCVSVEE